VLSFLRKLSPSVPTIDVAELDALLADGAVRILDVREEHEFRRGHVRGAVNLPTSRLGARLDQLRRDKPYAVICESGSRSMGATARLLDAGFEGAVSVRGGTSAWIRSGRPVVR
jgi:rhodanese-related sulfurtransferase